MKNQAYFIEKDHLKERHQEAESFLQWTARNQIATAAHIHDTIELIYVTKGSFRVSRNNTEHLLHEGDLILFCSNDIHHIIAGDEERSQYCVVKARTSLLFQISNEGGTALPILRFAISSLGYCTLWHKEDLQRSPILTAMSRLLGEVQGNRNFKEFAIRLAVSELLLAILREDAKEESTSPLPHEYELSRAFYDAVFYIRRNYAGDIDERRLAAEMNISYSYFSRCFKRILGKSFKEYLNQTRVDHAEQLLLTTNKSVTEVAAECGYNNVSYFISVYKQLKGYTPKHSVRHFNERNGTHLKEE